VPAADVFIVPEQFMGFVFVRYNSRAAGYAATTLLCRLICNLPE